MKYTVSIDVPSIDEGLALYCETFGFAKSKRPVEGYVILKCGEVEIGLLEKPAGTRPAEGSNGACHNERHWTPVYVDFSVVDFCSLICRIRRRCKM